MFVTPQTHTISGNSTGGFADYINIVEGRPLTHRYIYNRTGNTSFVLPNQNVDMTSIRVSVVTSGDTQTYIPANDILSVNSNSQVFFIESDRNYQYKVSFGDGVLGKQPATSSVVAISYRVCSGKAPNGANNFVLVDTTLDGQTSIFVNPVGKASGGAEIEDIESIRFNAPKIYETQNRSVVISDYEQIILRDNPDIQSISVWGGEENDPPVYGKVFISAKPKNTTSFSNNRKYDIINNIRKYNVQSIDVEIVDPTYLYVVPAITVRYDSNMTTMTSGELADAVAKRVVSFEANYLSTFSKNFKYSKFLEYLDGTDDSIQSTTAIIRLRKQIVPSTTYSNSYTINFNNKIQKIGSSLANSDISVIVRAAAYGSMTSSSFSFFACSLDHRHHCAVGSSSPTHPPTHLPACLPACLTD
jgi:hypothetical protein